MLIAAWSRWPVRRRVLVNLDDGRAFDGILWARRGPLLVLRDARLLDPAAPEAVATDGEVVIERRRVVFIQAR